MPASQGKKQTPEQKKDDSTLEEEALDQVQGGFAKRPDWAPDAPLSGTDLGSGRLKKEKPGGA